MPCWYMATLLHSYNQVGYLVVLYICTCTMVARAFRVLVAAVAAINNAATDDWFLATVIASHAYTTGYLLPVNLVIRLTYEFLITYGGRSWGDCGHFFLPISEGPTVKRSRNDALEVTGPKLRKLLCIFIYIIPIIECYN